MARFAVAVVLCVAKPGKELPLEFAYSPSTQIDRLKAGWGAGAEELWLPAMASAVGCGGDAVGRPGVGAGPFGR